MRITAEQTDMASLAALGLEAAKLLIAEEFAAMADSFSYALAYGREPVSAIQEDLALCLSKINAKAPTPLAHGATAKVVYFSPNDSGLFAVVACCIPTDSRHEVLVELIVTSKGTDKFVTLEQLTALA